MRAFLVAESTMRFTRYHFAVVLIAALAFSAGALLFAPHITVRSYPQTAVLESVMAPAPKNISIAAPQIAQAGSLTVAVDDVNRAREAAMRIVRDASGFVSSMRASSDPSRPARADMSLRVPAASFGSTLAALATLGTVTQRSMQGEDLRGPMTDTGARLRNLRHTEHDILKIMDRSGNVDQIMNVENRLSDVRGQIETLESELKDMHGRVTYATIDVRLVARAANALPEDSAFVRIADSAHAALHALASASVAIVAGVIWLAVFMPLVAVASAVAYVSWLRLRKYAVRR